MELKMKIESELFRNGFKTYCVLYGSMAHRCGYVVIPNDLRGKCNDNIVNSLDVHGGITHNGVFGDERFGKGIYTIGFDCIHLGDMPDFKSAKNNFKYSDDELKVLSFMENNGYDKNFEVVRTQEYVENQLDNLTKQLKEVLS
jgi:hypothetical protein